MGKFRKGMDVVGAERVFTSMVFFWLILLWIRLARCCVRACVCVFVGSLLVLLRFFFTGQFFY